MAKTLTFLHTSPVHIATFDRLLAEADPTIPVRHIVDEQLLHDARHAGTITPELAQRVTDTVLAAVAHDAAVVVCTCSTIGGCAEQAKQYTSQPVVRVDRAMAEHAVAAGSRIIVVAALASTLAPTRQLLLAVAHDAGKTITITQVLCDDAWSKFEAGDQAGYIHEIANTIREVAHAGDVVVLAQASMADAATQCADVAIPVLSSPRLGVEAAVTAYYAHDPEHAQ